MTKQAPNDDELDDLLDEALLDLDETLEKNDKKVKKMEKEVDSAVQKVDEENPMDIGKLLEALVGPTSGDPTDTSSITQQLHQLLSALDGDADPEDKAKLEALRKALDSVDNNDFDGASEIINQLQPEEPLGADGTAGPDLSGGDADLAKALFSTCMSPEMVAMMELLRDAFPAWIEQHPDLSDEEKERHQKQYEKSIEVCTLLRNNADGSKCNEILEAFTAFSELGDLPADIAEYAPKQPDAEGSE